MIGETSRSSASTAGFTLIELLVVLALIGLLTVALFGGLRFSARATDRSGAAIDHASQLALAYGFLQSQLSNTQPFPATADPKDQEIIFSGTPDQLDLVTTAPSRLAVGGFFQLRLTTASNNGQLRLIGEWLPLPRRASGSLETVLQPAVILEHLRSIRFAYFGATDVDDPAEWHDRWQAVSNLPKQIRVRVYFADGWQSPDLIVAPRLAEGSGTNG
jgi:general secretion pathway protein J